MSTCVYVLTSHNDITWSKSLVITGQNNRFAARRINALPVSVVDTTFFTILLTNITKHVRGIFVRNQEKQQPEATCTKV